jgi:hypothetical protein
MRPSLAQDDSLAIYVALDSADKPVEINASAWKIGLWSDHMKQYLPKTSVRDFGVGGVILLREGRPVLGKRRVMFSWGYLCF